MVAFAAVPVKLPVTFDVIVLAMKLPEASLATIVEAPLAEAAVVFAFGRTPVTPVVNGKPVQLVKVPEVGVPSTGVAKVGDVDNTTLPEPVDVVTPVPPEITGSAEAKVKEVKCVTASTTFVPLLYTYMVLPAGTAIPVPVVFLTVTASAQPLLTR
jgi:hypothetical protein